MMRIAVTGSAGQVARSLADAATRLGVEVVRIGRPTLDLERPSGIASAIAAVAPDVVVNAAAYTAVDQAEAEPERVHAINAVGAGAVAAAARALGAPVIQLSTDYVFDGAGGRPYRETDEVRPLSVYGASKLEGERAIAAATPDHAIVRTAWVYAPWGRNFVRTILRLTKERDEIRVVADQRGSPTYAVDIAAAVVEMARALLANRDDPSLRGIFHLAGSGEATWAAFAEAIVHEASSRRHRACRIVPITTPEHPTVARRPASSQLDCTKLREIYGIRLPSWRASLGACMDRIEEA